MSVILPPKADFNGAEERRRSADTAIFSRVLYHLSYLGRKAADGGRNRARTCDLPGVNRTLSQLSYSPRLRPFTCGAPGGTRTRTDFRPRPLKPPRIPIPPPGRRPPPIINGVESC